jgi:signal transduction histidine kinase
VIFSINPSLITTIGYLFALLLYFTLLVFTVVNLRKAIHQSYFIFVFGLFLWTSTLYLYLYIDLGDWLLFLGRLNYASGVFVAGGLAYFFYVFPKKDIFFPRWGEISYLVFSLFVFAVTLFTDWVDKEEYMTPQGPDMILGDHYSIYAFYILSSVFIASVFGFRKSFILTGLEKIKFHYSFFIFVPTCALAYFLSIILPIFGVTSQFNYMFLSTIPIALSSFYAIHQYRFFHFSFFTLWVLRTFILVTTFLFSLFVTYLLCLVFLPSTNELLNLTISAILALIAFHYAAKFFPHLTTNSVRELQNAMKNISSCTSYKSYTNLQSLLDSVFVLQLNISKAQVYTVRKQKTPISYIPCYEKNNFTEYLEKKSVLVLDELRLKEKHETIIQTMESLDAQLCFPLFAEKNLIGFFVLGNKDTSYAREEIEEIMRVLPQIEIILMNILLNLNLQEENNMMKAIIEEKTKDLKKQYTKINQLLKQQSDLIAMTAHELRTPLSIALFQLEDICDSQKENSQILADLTVLENSLGNLKDLMQRLFDVQQYDLKKVSLQKEETDISSFVDKIYKEFQAPMRESHISFSFKNLLQKKKILRIDRSRIRQLLYNLLGNAIKFTKKKGRVRILISPEKDGILLSLFNEGNHISDMEKNRIFEKFHTKSGVPLSGIGLGLYVCKKTIELHKGNIWIENVPDGVEFHVFLPQ